MNATLHALLEAGLALAPEYTDAHTAHSGPAPAYASHLPMALHALSALGADSATLQAFDRRERAQQPPRAPWPGLDADEAGLRMRIANKGAASVVAERLPARMAHAGAVAFHGLIRTAHAWESGHAGELALALAWWGQRDQAVPTQPAAHPGELPLPAWLDALRALPQPNDLPRAWIAARMQAWSSNADFQALAPRLQLQARTLHDLAAWALDAYARSGNFTLLHAVTATRALAVLGPLLPAHATTDALRAFSLHLAAAVLASGWRGVGLATEPEPAAEGWPALRARALAHTDDHAIKLTHAAWDWAQRGQDEALCRQAATRALGAAR